MKETPSLEDCLDAYARCVFERACHTGELLAKNIPECEPAIREEKFKTEMVCRQAVLDAVARGKSLKAEGHKEWQPLIERCPSWQQLGYKRPQVQCERPRNHSGVHSAVSTTDPFKDRLWQWDEERTID